MARPGISKTEVFEKANQLVGEGVDPTIEQIRLRLGTGSNSTIATFLREWRSLQKDKSSVELNEHLPHEFIGLMKGLWQRLLSQADSKVDSIRQEFEQIVTAYKTEVESSKHETIQLQQLNQQIKSEKDSLFNDHTALQQVLAGKQHDIISLNEKQSGLLVQLDEKQQTIQELRHLHKQSQDNLEHYREQAREQRMLNDERHAREKQQLELTIKELQQALLIVNQEKIKFEQYSERIVQEKALLQQSYDVTMDKYNKTQQAFSQLERLNDETTRLLKIEQEQHLKLQKTTEEQNKMLIELQKQIAVQSQQLNDAAKATYDLKEQHKLLSLEKWELAQEKSQLIGQLKQLQEMIQLREVS